MTKKVKNSRLNIFDIVLALLIIAIPVLVSFQGYDLDDTGTHIFNALHLFDPEVQTTSQIFYSNLITYVFYRIFGGFGLVSVFMLNAAVYIVSAFLSVNILKDVMPRTYALAGSLVSVAVEMKFIHVVSYNTYTVLFFVICCLFLYKGMTDKKHSGLNFLLCGIFGGLGVFVRLPNLLIILLGAAFIYWAVVNAMKLSEFATKVLIYLLGFAAAVGFSVLLIVSLNKAFDANIMLLGVSSSMNRGVSYSFSELLGVYISTAFEALSGVWYILLPIFFTVCGMLCGRIKNKLVSTVLYIACFGATVGFSVKFMLDGVPRNLFPVSCWIALLLTFVLSNTKKRYDPKLAALSIMAVVISVVTFAGSNTGISHANLCLNLALPIAIYEVSVLLKAVEVDAAGRVLRKTLALMLSVVFVYNYIYFSTTYFEPTDRAEIAYSVDSPKLKGLYTSKFKSEYAKTVIEKVAPLDNKYMIVYPGYDLFYYLTDKKPYTGECGIFFKSYSIERLKSDMENNRDKELPIVLFSKAEPYSVTGEGRSARDEKWQVISDFMNENSYTVYYSDEYTEIYVPTE